MSNNTNWKLGFGLVIGAVAGYWLNTAEGRRVRKQAQHQLNTYGEQAGTFVAETSQKLESTVKEYVEQGKTIVQDTAVTAKTNLISGADTTAGAAERGIDSVAESLKKGIAKARKNVKKGAEKLA